MNRKSNYKLELLSAHAVWDATCGPYDEGTRFLFSPQMVIERYELSHQSEMTREPLKDWMAFENCQVDWDYHDFERMILTGIDSDVYLFLVTDEGLMERSVFGFRRADFRDFAVWYESEYHMDFFQSSDYIVFDRKLAWLRVLHHEGFLFENR